MSQNIFQNVLYTFPHQLLRVDWQITRIILLLRHNHTKFWWQNQYNVSVFTFWIKVRLLLFIRKTIRNTILHPPPRNWRALVNVSLNTPFQIRKFCNKWLELRLDQSVRDYSSLLNQFPIFRFNWRRRYLESNLFFIFIKSGILDFWCVKYFSSYSHSF